MSDLPTICVCGAGTMGSGIARVFAENNFPTVLFDVNEEMLKKAKEKISTHAADAAKNVAFTASIDDCKAEVIIEAIVENESAKADLINQLASLNNSDTIFATNTSSISISAIGERIGRPENFAGMHFFNPAPVMKLVEIVAGKKSSEKTIKYLADLSAKIGKTPVICKDSPGFIVNRVARPFYLEALHLAEKHAVSFTTIDSLMESSGFRMGPFKLMDLIGNDINFAVSNIVYQSLGKPSRLKPSNIQKSLVEEGLLGRKSGKGYYDYSNA